MITAPEKEEDGHLQRGRDLHEIQPRNLGPHDVERENRKPRRRLGRSKRRRYIARRRSCECCVNPWLDANRRSRRGESRSVPRTPCRRDSSHPHASCRTPRRRPAYGSARSRRSPRDPTCSSRESAHTRTMRRVGARNAAPTERSRSAWCSSWRRLLRSPHIRCV